jgi:hypothetical protein
MSNERTPSQIPHSESIRPHDYSEAYFDAQLDGGYSDKFLNDLYTAIGQLTERNAKRRRPIQRYNPTPAALRYLRLASRHKRQEDS